MTDNASPDMQQPWSSQGDPYPSSYHAIDRKASVPPWIQQEEPIKQRPRLPEDFSRWTAAEREAYPELWLALRDNSVVSSILEDDPRAAERQHSRRPSPVRRTASAAAYSTDRSHLHGSVLPSTDTPRAQQQHAQNWSQGYPATASEGLNEISDALRQTQLDFASERSVIPRPFPSAPTTLPSFVTQGSRPWDSPPVASEHYRAPRSASIAYGQLPYLQSASAFSSPGLNHMAMPGTMSSQGKHEQQPSIPQKTSFQSNPPYAVARAHSSSLVQQSAPKYVTHEGLQFQLVTHPSASHDNFTVDTAPTMPGFAMHAHTPQTQHTTDASRSPSLPHNQSSPSLNHDRLRSYSLAGTTPRSTYSGFMQPPANEKSGLSPHFYSKDNPPSTFATPATHGDAWKPGPGAPSPPAYTQYSPQPSPGYSVPDSLGIQFGTASPPLALGSSSHQTPQSHFGTSSSPGWPPSDRSTGSAASPKLNFEPGGLAFSAPPRVAVGEPGEEKKKGVGARFRRGLKDMFSTRDKSDDGGGKDSSMPLPDRDAIYE